MHFLEILKSSVNHNVVLVRPEHGGHVHLEKGTCRCYHHTADTADFSHNESHRALTLLFSLCSTPIKRTLRGNRWASMSEPQRLGSVSDVPAVLSLSASLPCAGSEAGMLCRCICTRSSFRCGRVTHRRWKKTSLSCAGKSAVVPKTSTAFGTIA